MTPSKINFSDKLLMFNDYWSPKVIAEMNAQQFKLVKLKGEFVWHCHHDTDETFLVIAGELAIRFRDKTVHLQAGEMLVVPKGVEHQPVAKEECHVLLIEACGVQNTGDAGGDLTAEQDVWI